MRLSNYGRKEIFTSELNITSDNIIPVLQKALGYHDSNVADMNFLINYEAGEQPLQRTKTYRKDIDVVNIDNVAAEVTQFKCGFMWGYPITLVQRAIKDKGADVEGNGIVLLNECFDAEELRAKTQKLARFVEITGVGYTLLEMNNEYADGESPFSYNVLDPRFAFIIKSNMYADHRPMVGVSYAIDDDGVRHYTCFTKNRRFEITQSFEIINGNVKQEKWYEGQRSGELNPLGIIPMVEWVRSADRMGCFERQIEALDSLNIMQSDFANDVDQNTQAIWHGNDIEFPVDSDGNVIKPKSNDWIMTKTVDGGGKPSVTPLSVSYDYNGILNNITTTRAMILQKCNVPQRNDNSGGSTGIAMSDATGWSNAEVEANAVQGLQEASKMREVKIALAIIKISPDVAADNAMLQLKYSDVKPNIKRQKTYEMTTKSNAFATLVSHGIDYKSAIQAINFFDDPQQVAEDSAETIKAYQDSIFNKQNDAVGGEGEQSADVEKTNQDESDQVSNSPMLG